MAKMGRPKLEESKNRNINIRVTTTEYKKMQEYAQTHNLTMTQALRRGVEKLLSTS